MSYLARHLRNNIVGYLALVIAMGGTSYAAIALPRGSVGTVQLQRGAVTTPKIRAGAVTTGKLALGAVKTGRLANGSVTSPKLGAGSVNSGKVADHSLLPVDLAPGTAPMRGWVDDPTWVALPSGGGFGEVDAIGSGPGDHSGKVVIPAASRIFVTASAGLQNLSGSTRTMSCLVELRPSDGSPVRRWNQTGEFVDANGEESWSQTTSFAVSPGTYDVALMCSTWPANNGGSAGYADLTVEAQRS